MTSARLRQDGETREVRLENGVALFGDRRVTFEYRERDGRIDEIVIDGRRYRIAAARDGDKIFVWCDGTTRTFQRVRGERIGTAGDHDGDLLSPMPGRVRRTFVGSGQTVTRGQVLMVLEAMKMEHAIRAPRDGVVKRLHVKEGDLVDSGVELAEIAAQ